MKEYEKPQMEIIELSGAGVIAQDPFYPSAEGEEGWDDDN